MDRTTNVGFTSYDETNKSQDDMIMFSLLNEKLTNKRTKLKYGSSQLPLECLD